MTEKRFFRRMWIGPEDTVQDWIPGKPTELDLLIKKIGGAAAQFGEGAEQLRKLNTEPWQGEAAEEFRKAVKKLPKELDDALDAFLKAGAAVLTYRDALDGVQRLTQRILAEEAPTARELSRRYEKAVDDYNTAVKAGGPTGTRPPAEDPGRTLMAELVGMITTAKRDVADAAAAAKRTLNKATEKAPKRPSNWERVKGGAKEGWNDLVEFGLTVNPGRLLTEPGAYLQDGAMVLDGGITAVRDPVAFSKTVYQGASNTWDEFEKDPFRMLGYVAPSLAGGAALRGAGAMARGSLGSGHSGSDFLGGHASRGSGDPMPEHSDVLRALQNARPEVISQRWPDDDGRYYADRVLAGGRPDGETVLAGHGYLYSDAGEIEVPEGTSISFYVEHGGRLPGVNGLAVERGVYPGGYVETFHAGDRIPNYTLAAPSGSGGGTFSVFENSTTVAQRTPLGDLLKPGMGNVHWAACREFK